MALKENPLDPRSPAYDPNAKTPHDTEMKPKRRGRGRPRGAVNRNAERTRYKTDGTKEVVQKPLVESVDATDWTGAE